jgi:cell division septum initiation protein DivIVA
LLEERQLLQLAEQRSCELIEEATRQAEDMRDDADNYALQVLSALCQELDRYRGDVKHGIARLDQELERYRSEVQHGIARLERMLHQAPMPAAVAPEVGADGAE